MTSRRSFVATSLLGVAAAAQPFKGISKDISLAKKKAPKHWIWTNPDVKDTEEQLATRYKQYYEAGVRGVFFEADSEKHFRAAKAQKLEAHRWMWTMNRGEKTLLSSHPEWYAINHKGESCADKPPYVDYYRWLCPSKPEVLQYLKDQVSSILQKDYVDGIHLDYIRFCDVILPVNLWDKYGIDQTRELPEYDYCYCDVCRSKFKAWRGTDINDIQYPQASLSWRLFRYNAVNNIVNNLALVANSYKKPITAAVFPTPEIARRNVRQDWTNWNLNGICPMIYHGFYKEKVEWIGDAVTEGVHFLNGRFPLYAGLYLPDFKNNEELHKGIVLALQHGAAGVSLFGNPPQDILDTLKSATASSQNTI
ncbi:family 10 glycosylhydrolase [Mucilaginibacter lacusdianchii]|uniref:family 10 glycosylhydrolase n=1 Tax=Mucilaginibacter lacusdianchii TaxID=2684211 RepID=UPI00131DCCB5|nr:family 10 glycosylhydrolase [Mucilaginibacter sp. JXJ CY 39]